MARKSTGNNLKRLALQSGSEFTSTEMGFDTGSRSVICDETVALSLEPKLGMSDTEIKYYTQFGEQFGIHQWMFVTNVNVTNETNGLVKMRIDFRGRKLVQGQRIGSLIKYPFYQDNIEQVQFEAAGNQVTINLQSVDMTYLTVKIDDIPPLNSLVAAPPNNSNLSKLFNLETGTLLAAPRFQGWQVTGRQSQSVGIPGKRQMWQITDTITERVLF
jgi:hypothetical protein